jgi:vacuolar-type H+-ATPase subunit H
MDIRKSIKELIGEEEIPRFSDFKQEDIQELLDFFLNKQHKEEQTISEALYQMEEEKKDNLRSLEEQYNARKDKIINEGREKIWELERLIRTLRLRQGGAR